MARASNLMIGTLTLVLIAGSFGAMFGYQKLAGIKQRTPFRVVFEGSASGLRKGGSVNFAGIRVGEVVSLKLDNPRRVVALAMIDSNTPVRKDTQVGLEFQGLTGIAAISFTGGSVDAPPVPLGEDGIPVLTADPNALQLAVAARDAWHMLGAPEGYLPLAEMTIYLATAPKSNSAKTALLAS